MEPMMSANCHKRILRTKKFGSMPSHRCSSYDKSARRPAYLGKVPQDFKIVVGNLIRINADNEEQDFPRVRAVQKISKG
jgi:hypothetical protein